MSLSFCSCFSCWRICWGPGTWLLIHSGAAGLSRRRGPTPDMTGGETSRPTPRGSAPPLEIHVTELWRAVDQIAVDVASGVATTQLTAHERRSYRFIQWSSET